MKYKILLFVFLSLFVTTLSGQTSEVTSHKLNWQEPEKWSIGASSITVLSFEDARYPDETRLPFFTLRVPSDRTFSYQTQLKNEVYIPLTNAEKEILPDNAHLTSEPQIIIDSKREGATSYMDLRILPIVIRDGALLKLKSFDLQIDKLLSAQKVSSSTRHTYAPVSVLAQGKFVKIRVQNSGVYKLTFEDLNAMGVNPANVRIFGYGGGVLEQSFMLPKLDDLPELAIWMEKGQDGVFNAGDYILFYAQGINRWSYDKTKSMFVHVGNSYSKYGYYFVTSDAGTGKKISEKMISLPPSPVINTIEEFVDFQVHERELTTIAKSGREFYGETYYNDNVQNITFSFPNPVTTNSTLVRLDVAANASATSNFRLRLNGAQERNLSVAKRTDGDHYETGKAASGIFSFTPDTDPFVFGLNYVKPNSTAVGYLNYLEVNTRRLLKMSGSVMQFQNVDYLGSSVYLKYMLSNANANVQIWDITNQQDVAKMITERVDGKLTFVGHSAELTHYLAIDPTVSSAFPKPDIVGVVPNQNLHGLSGIDMIILTHPNFVSQAQTLAQAHREKSNLTVEVVTTEQVYNEFSSGTPDATAYRWIMKMLYDRANASNKPAELPKYLLLFGRGSFDNRGIIPESGDNLVLTYQAENSLVITLSYLTDDYFGFLEDNEGAQVPTHTLDIGIGRFPVTTLQQATDVVNKTINYMNNTQKGNWKNQLCFLADDGDGALHMKQADSITSMVARNFPGYQLNRIYLDAYKQEITASGESYPLAKSRFQNLLRSGLFLLNYTGHAGPGGWTNEHILTTSDVKSLSNKNLPIWVGATCDFLQFDVKQVSGGEQVVLNPLGGGIGILSAARPVYASQNFTLNKLFNEHLFLKTNGQHPRVGDVLRMAKNKVGTEINKLSYVYLGDPAVKLNYPTEYRVVTSKVNESTVFGNDTLKALSVASIEGFIADDNGVLVDNFNGTVHLVVYDKVQRITTMNNHNDGAITYSDRLNTLFSGKAEVINGKYSISFMLPKDIKYNYGAGRINYYAQDDINDFEAQGYFENFIVGGTSRDYVVESDGPEVELYLNSENFVSGDKVNESPLFIANIKDINGINTVGSGIGHDIMLTIDEDPNQSYILNEHFSAAVNSYSEGTVKYKLPEMKAGKHTLTFRVWDLLNNSTTKTIDFEVVKGLTPVIFGIRNYPNPVKSQTFISVHHDRPETILNTTVEIFDLSGRKIWSFTQASADSIPWNLQASDGRRVNPGVYLYRVNIKTADSELTSKTNKMIILEQ